MNQAELASIRFGYGLGSGGQPADAAGLLQGLSRPDRAADRYPMRDEDAAAALFLEYNRLQRANRSGDEADKVAFGKIKRQIAQASAETPKLLVARILDSDSRFRDRLLTFWADHFTVRPKSNKLTLYVQPYLDSTLRPHLTGRFADMLKAVETSPLMLFYLDQNGSIGPHSQAGLKRKRGLNENLAREMLELHTLGVGGAYGQGDVRQLAELLTGLDYRAQKGFAFRRTYAEPGAETVLGVAYGGDPAKLADVHAVLDALAVHPDTARHIARKLAVHFVSDTPDPGLVDSIAAAWRDSGGQLMAAYAALLDHPAAWVPDLAKAKQPFDFMVSSLVALGMTGEDVIALSQKAFHRHVDLPMRTMGQRFFRAPGPDGWPEEAEAWITPQGLAVRIRWAQRSPRRLVETLPDPRDFLVTALGGAASPRLTRAVRRAESQIQGVALALSSPAFNRR